MLSNAAHPFSDLAVQDIGFSCVVVVDAGALVELLG